MRAPALLSLLLATACSTTHGDQAKSSQSWPIVYQQQFLASRSLADFAFTDASRWEWHQERGETALRLLGSSKYRPPHRSPTSIALLKDFEVRDFDLEVDLEQTGHDTAHRDLCLFFGLQSNQRFYYTHLATSPDENSHNIFRVAGAPRTNIAPVAEQGIDWGRDEWHHVRVERRVDTGTIRVFWDQQAEPVLTATDKAFDWGRIGFGSFDDSGLITNIVVRAPVSRSVQGRANPFMR